MALPLFKFPILVIKIILETMGFIDLFVLTNASSRTKRIVKHLLTIRNHSMHIFMRKEDIVFDIRRNFNPKSIAPVYMESKETQPDDVFHLRIGTVDRVPTAFEEGVDGIPILTVYWEKTVDHGNELHNALLEMFKMPLEEIKIDLNDVVVETYEIWINWYNDYFLDASYSRIVGTCSFHSYIWLLKNVRTKNTLSFRVEPTVYPEHSENIEILNIKAGYVAIWFGKWISLQQLKTIKAQKIVLFEVSLTDSQINTFIREWRNSKVASNFKELSVCFDRVANLDVVLEEMDVTDETLIKPNNVLNQCSFMLANGEKCTMLYARYVSEDDRNHGFEFHVGQ